MAVGTVSGSFLPLSRTPFPRQPHPYAVLSFLVNGFLRLQSPQSPFSSESLWHVVSELSFYSMPTSFASRCRLGLQARLEPLRSTI